MKKNSTKLTKKLKSYSALAGTLVAAGSVDAQVVYTDVAPDANITTGNMFSLDLDNNSVVDYTLNVQHGTYTYGTFVIQYDYTIAQSTVTANAVDTVSGGNANAHNINDPINGSLLWEDFSVAQYSMMALAFAPPFTPYNTGNFLGQNDKYLGLKFMIGTNTHYGWARVSVNATSTQMTVKDHGYNATPNTQVLCGANPSVVTENSLESIAIFGNANGINVNMNNAAVEGTIIVADVLGKEVANVAVSASNNVISMEGATAGVYFVSVYQNGTKITKKIFVK